MKKRKIIGLVVIFVILIGLIVFASVYPFADSHLRKEGIRVKVGEALIVDGCDEGKQDVTYCEKTIKVKGEDQKLVFEFKNFKENGFPNTVVASINNNEFYKEDGLKIEDNGSVEYKIFLNFQVIDEYILFTFTDGTNGRTTTLYAIDTKGNIVLEEKNIDEDEMLIKDYTDFITYEDNKITIYATRVVQDINYHKENVCNAPKTDIVEAYYTYTYKDKKFTKKQTKTITAEEFIEDKEIICANKD